MLSPPGRRPWSRLRRVGDGEELVTAYVAGVVVLLSRCGGQPDRDAFGTDDVIAGEAHGALDDAVVGRGRAVFFHADGAALVFF